MKEPKKESEYSKVVSSAPIKGLFSSMPSKKVKSMKKKKSIFSSKT
jgi:hypothetical protein